MHNWRRYRSSNWYEIYQKTRFEIWRSVVAPSDATEKNRNIGAQLQSILYTLLQKDIGKFTSCRTFGAQKLVHSEPFLDYLYEVWQLLSALYSDVQKKKLIQVRIYILGPKLLQWKFLQISAIYTKWCAQTFPPIFCLSQFFTAFSRKLWRHLATKMRTI